MPRRPRQPRRPVTPAALARAVVEALEPRRLLAAVYAVDFGFDAHPQRVDYVPLVPPPPPGTRGVFVPPRRPPLGGVFPNGGDPYVLTNLTIDAPVDRATLALGPGAAAGSFALTAPGLPGGVFADGNYELLLPVEEGFDGSDFHRIVEEPHGFFQLAGDVNRDRVVDLADWNVYQSHYGMASGATYADGDATGDGAVDSADSLIFYYNYGLRLPPPPTASNSVTAAAHPDFTASVQWTPPGDGSTPDGYRVYRSTDGANFERVAEVPDPAARAWTDAGPLAQGKRYWYRVRPYTAAAGSALTTNKFWAVTPLPAPTGFAATAASPTEASLSWSDAGDGTAGFAVQIESANGFWGTPVPPPPTYPDGTPTPEGTRIISTGRTTASVTGLTPGTAYRFRAVAKTPDAQSAPSDAAGVTMPERVPPDAPYNLAATSPAPGKIKLDWESDAADVASFAVQRLDPGAAWATVATTPGTARTWTDAGPLTQGDGYRYRVRAENPAGPSPYTAVTEARPSFAVPAAPTAVKAAANADGTVTLTWAGGSDNESGYGIYRSAGSGSPLVGWVGRDVKTFEVAGLASGGATPPLFVNAFNPAGGSAHVEATYPPADAGSNAIQLAAQIVSREGVVFHWVDDSASDEGYVLERETKNDGSWYHRTEDIASSGMRTISTWFGWVSGSPDERYKFRIKSLATGSLSNEVTVDGSQLAEKQTAWQFIESVTPQLSTSSDTPSHVYFDGGRPLSANQYILVRESGAWYASPGIHPDRAAENYRFNIIYAPLDPTSGLGDTIPDSITDLPYLAIGELPSPYHEAVGGFYTGHDFNLGEDLYKFGIANYTRSTYYGSVPSGTVKLNLLKEPELAYFGKGFTSSRRFSTVEGESVPVRIYRQSNDASVALNVKYALGGSTSSSDISGLGQAGAYGYSDVYSAMIPAGSQYVDILVHAVDDALVEGTETLSLRLLGSTNQRADDVATITIKDNDLKPNLVAHRTGGKFGEEVIQAVEDGGDPSKYLILTNNDYEEGAPDGGRDFANATAAIPKGTLNPADDDLARITLKRIGPVDQAGTLGIELSDPAAVRLFKSDGTELTDRTLDLASSTNAYLAGLYAGDVDVWVEGLKPDADLKLSLVHRDAEGNERGRDDVHVTIASVELQDINEQEIEFVSAWEKQHLEYAASNSGYIDDVLFPESSFRVSVQGLGASVDPSLSLTSDSGTGESSVFDVERVGSTLQTVQFGALYRAFLNPTDEEPLPAAKRAILKDHFGLVVAHNPKGTIKLDSALDSQLRKIYASPQVEVTFDKDIVTVGDIVSGQIKVTNPEKGARYAFVVEAYGDKQVVGPTTSYKFQFTAKSVSKDRLDVHFGVVMNPAGAAGNPSDSLVAWNDDQSILVLEKDAPGRAESIQAWEALRGTNGLVASYPNELYGMNLLTAKDLNNQISKVYASFYNKKPDIYKWAGLAAYVSNVGGDGIAASASLANFFRPEDGDTPLFRQMYEAFTDLNWTIYWDMIRQHFAFENRGMTGINDLYAAGLTSFLQRSGWQAIQDGIDAGNQPNPDAKLKAQRIWEGTTLLADDEQNRVAQAIYDTPSKVYHQVFGFISSHPYFKHFLKSPVPGDDSLFTDVVPHAVNGGGDPNVAVAADRWRWFTTPQLGLSDKWKDWNQTHSSIPLVSIVTKFKSISGPNGVLEGVDAFGDALNWRPS